MLTLFSIILYVKTICLPGKSKNVHVLNVHDTVSQWHRRRNSLNVLNYIQNPDLNGNTLL